MRTLRCLLLGAMLAGGPVLAQAQAIDPADLESYLDGLIEGRMASQKVVGVTLSVVHNGEIVLLKGYGHADLDADIAVDPRRSLFRPGSISKTLTWTAAMQLYERGLLDLDADISTYLPNVPIADAFDAQITMRHLMAHAPGFEETALGHLFVESADDVLPLVDYLNTHQPARVRPPGTWSAYSNYGSALAGQIVANLAEQPFEDYVDEHILEPLGMAGTTFREPWGAQRPGAMPADLLARMSKGYTRAGVEFRSSDFEFVGQIGPAGALSTTALDMAVWMLTHLGGGGYGDARILSAETAALMHTQHFAQGEHQNGLRHGFIESRVHGYPAFGHGGGTVHFLSNLVMVPELDFGLFVSTNTQGGGGRLIAELADLVVARYFDAGDGWEAPEPPADFAQRAAKYAGAYQLTRRSFSTLERMLNPQVIAVTPADNHLVLALGANPVKLVEVGSDTFRDVRTGNWYQFETDAAGDVQALYLSLPIMVAERIGPLTNPNNQLVLAGIALLVMGVCLISAWYRRGSSNSVDSRRATRALVVMCALWWVATLVVAIPLSAMASDVREVFYAFPQPMLIAGLWVIIAAVLATLVNVALLASVWRSTGWSLGRRLRHVAVVLLAVDLSIVLWVNNAVGFHYF